MLAREEQRDVHRHAGEDRLFDGRKAFLGAGDLDEDVGSPRAGMQILGRLQGTGGVVGQKG